MPGGMASTSELARLCDIHRTTAKRLLETLRHEGLVAVGEKDGQYCLARDIRLLSDGYADDDWVTRVAGPAMRAMSGKLVWPCNLGTLDGGQMVIRESTRRSRPLSHQHALIGEKLPLLLSSLGRAYLAACGTHELQAILVDLKLRAKVLGILADDLTRIPDIIEETRSRGYAQNVDRPAAKFTSIGVPVFSGDKLLGAINLVFTKNSQGVELIEEKYVVLLKMLARDIGVASKSWLGE